MCQAICQNKIYGLANKPEATKSKAPVGGLGQPSNRLMAKPRCYGAFPVYRRLIGLLRETARKLVFLLAGRGTFQSETSFLWRYRGPAERSQQRRWQKRSNTRPAKSTALPSRTGPTSWAANPVTSARGCAVSRRKFGGIAAKPHGRRCWGFHLVKNFRVPSVRARTPEPARFSTSTSDDNFVAPRRSRAG